ncbi:MAG: glycosyltransferase family 2 protein, partial [Pikeienuella sp.]
AAPPNISPRSNPMRVAAIIPAHNEILTVREVVAATLPHVDAVYLLDDGSTDGTADAVEGRGAIVVRGEGNLGKGARLAQGLDLVAAGGFVAAVTLDADNQHDPAAIPAFLEAAAKDPAAIVIGDRSADMGKMGARRRYGIRFGNFFIGWACRRKVRDAQCGMRLYPVAIWRRVEIPKARMRGFLFETAILIHGAEAGANIAHVPVAARYDGFVLRPSHFRPIMDFLRLFGMVTAFLLSRGLRPDGLRAVLGLTPEPTQKERGRSRAES